MIAAESSKFRQSLSALGVVFGDIGTSPLYALSAIILTRKLSLNDAETIYGVTSLLIWTLIFVVSVKYIAFIMKADNDGEGGIMALMAGLKQSKLSRSSTRIFVIVGLLGMALFYGDSVITPAISVLSAVEGIQEIAPGLAQFILPITLTVLAALFWIQRYGTGSIGKFFGPIMLLWFVTLAAGGLAQVIQSPEILKVLNPILALNLALEHPVSAFLLMGVIVLVVTGAEALYADMGHFGRPAIARAWYFVVLPALILSYLGQTALLLGDASRLSNPFLLMYPAGIRLPLIVLATLATLIASQAVISGAFSLTRQAVQLDVLPKLTIRHTSDRSTGQIYVPFVNFMLFIAVCLLIIVFESSARLAGAYGLAVSGALLADTILFIAIMRSVIARSVWRTLLVGSFIFVDVIFVLANLPKIVNGGALPITLSAVAFLLMITWYRGQRIIAAERRHSEGSLRAFIEKIHAISPPLTRVPGRAVYVGHHAGLAPLALHAAVEQLHELHEKVVVVTVNVSELAHIAEENRADIDELGYEDGIAAVNLHFGFHDHINIPRELDRLRSRSPELDFDQSEASYFVSLSRVSLTKRRNMSYWQKAAYALLDRNSLSLSDYYRLPVDRTIEIRSLIKL